MTVRRIRPGRRMSEAVIHNDRIYTSGLTANPPTGSAEEQTRNILQQIDRLLLRPCRPLVRSDAPRESARLELVPCGSTIKAAQANAAGNAPGSTST